MANSKHKWENFWPGVASGLVTNLIWGVLGLIGVALIAVMGRTNVDPNQQTYNQDPVNRTYPIQQKVQDVNSEINLYDLECGSRKYKDYYNAKGEFCILTTLIVNRGNATDNLIPYRWKIYVGNTEYKVTSYEGDAFEDILPGSSGSGTVAFDITAGKVPNSIVVYGTGYTSGLKINF